MLHEFRFFWQELINDCNHFSKHFTINGLAFRLSCFRQPDLGLATQEKIVSTKRIVTGKYQPSAGMFLFFYDVSLNSRPMVQRNSNRREAVCARRTNLHRPRTCVSEKGSVLLLEVCFVAILINPLRHLLLRNGFCIPPKFEAFLSLFTDML